MKTKIYYNRDLIGRFQCGAVKLTLWKRIVKYFKKWLLISAKVCIAMWLLMGAFQTGLKLTPQKVVYADKEVVKLQELKFEDIPLLVKICNAESEGKQFLKNGDVVRGKVNHADIGYCQINETINNDEARRLGFDIYTEKGNKDYAVYLFLHRGTQPWNASKKSIDNPNGWTI